MRKFGLSAGSWIAAWLLASQAAGAQAQSYPARPVQVIVPFAANGAADLVARTVVQKMGQGLGQPVVLDNRPGAGGTAGTAAAAAAPADGYTLLLGMSSTMVISPAAVPGLAYEPERDFAPVGLITAIPNVLAVNPSVPARSLGELIGLLRNRPGTFAYGSTGAGSAAHLTAELFKAAAGVDVAPVEYRSTAAALADLREGRIGMMFLPVPAVLTGVHEGELNLLAVTARQRMYVLPLPTMAEAGLAGFDASFWYGLFAPARTPVNIVARLNAQLNAALGDPRVNATLLAQGGVPSPGSPKAFADLLAADRLKWGALIKSLGFRVQ
jgi:tripartite-type tricarboxylate transporter receptor subunit TctC